MALREGIKQRDSAALEISHVARHERVLIYLSRGRDQYVGLGPYFPLSGHVATEMTGYLCDLLGNGTRHTMVIQKCLKPGLNPLVGFP